MARLGATNSDREEIMSLLTRLLSYPGEESISIHQFAAACAEFKRGAPGVNLDKIAEVFGLDDTEKAHLQEFLTNLTGNTIDRHRIADVLILGTTHPQHYTLTVVKNRLGLTNG